MKNLTYFLVGVAILLVLVVLVPIAVIWSLNTLFPVLAIPLTWKTWFAAAVLSSVVGGQYGIRLKK